MICPARQLAGTGIVISENSHWKFPIFLVPRKFGGGFPPKNNRHQVNPATVKLSRWSSGSWPRTSRRNCRSGVGQPPNRSSEKRRRTGRIGRKLMEMNGRWCGMMWDDVGWCGMKFGVKNDARVVALVAGWLWEADRWMVGISWQHLWNPPGAMGCFGLPGRHRENRADEEGQAPLEGWSGTHLWNGPEFILRTWQWCLGFRIHPTIRCPVEARGFCRGFAASILTHIDPSQAWPASHHWGASCGGSMERSQTIHGQAKRRHEARSDSGGSAGQLSLQWSWYASEESTRCR